MRRGSAGLRGRGGDGPRALPSTRSPVRPRSPALVWSRGTRASSGG